MKNYCLDYYKEFLNILQQKMEIYLAYIFFDSHFTQLLPTLFLFFMVSLCLRVINK